MGPDRELLGADNDELGFGVNTVGGLGEDSVGIALFVSLVEGLGVNVGVKVVPGEGVLREYVVHNVVKKDLVNTKVVDAAIVGGQGLGAHLIYFSTIW